MSRMAMLTSASVAELLRLPKVMSLRGCWRPDGGRPPLADGCGMGDGECAGEGTLALPPGTGMGAELPVWGVL